ncbi:ABC transporter ATP-binding protein [Salibacterium lacus]|uniref:ABC transporter ATP-binding protein n=1 Tax=Salibacterium lacus TaxID=1898109 RepID=A0ABW5T418_9BACI
MSILRTDQIEARYENHTVFKDLNISIAEGRITTIIGPNGCGKSTLLKTIGRILKQTGGQVFLQEENLNTIPTREIARRLSLLPQNPAAPGELTVEELIAYGRYPHRKNINKLTGRDQEMIEWAMELTKTAAFRSRSIGTLSGGQKQKVWLAMALAQHTKVLLLDEPTTYLDMAHQLDVLQIVETLNRDYECSVVMVLHDINHAARFSHEMVAMKEGEIIASGEPADIMKEGVLRDVFDIQARVMMDPQNGAPVCYGYESLFEQEKQHAHR